MKDGTPIELGDLLRWLDMKHNNTNLGTGSVNEIFDLGQQISDDIKTGNLNNGFVIYDNDGKIRIISIFKDAAKKAPMSRNLLTEIIKYLSKINKSP
jgi:hypothetical protein